MVTHVIIIINFLVIKCFYMVVFILLLYLFSLKKNYKLRVYHLFKVLYIYLSIFLDVQIYKGFD